MHHLRKQGDSDPLNKLSGTTGISGAVDAVFVLDKSKRSQDNATLVATGRDIEYRELEIRFSKDTHTWELVSDSLDDPRLLLPSEMEKLISCFGKAAFSAPPFRAALAKAAVIILTLCVGAFSLVTASPRARAAAENAVNARVF